MSPPGDVVLLPDAGPLITLAYADALDLLLKPGWPIQLVDMVLHEVTRSATPTSEKIRQWAADTGKEPGLALAESFRVMKLTD